MADPRPKDATRQPEAWDESGVFGTVADVVNYDNYGDRPDSLGLAPTAESAGLRTNQSPSYGRRAARVHDDASRMTARRVSSMRERGGPRAALAGVMGELARIGAPEPAPDPLERCGR
jgi:hypothetical protein